MWNSGVKMNSSVRSIRAQYKYKVTLTVYQSTGALLCCHMAVVSLSSLQTVAIPTYHTLMPCFSYQKQNNTKHYKSRYFRAEN